MRLNITHKTTYSYDRPVHYALLQLRMTPRSAAGQKVLNWSTTLEGATSQVTYDDHFRNVTELIEMDAGSSAVSITCQGEVEVENLNGVIGMGTGLAPLWLFLQQTPATVPGPTIRKIAQQVKKATEASQLDGMHQLSGAIADAVTYRTGMTLSTTPAEDAASEGQGVCQDHAQIMIAAARHLGLPARYVSGYLLMDEVVDQEASHAWAEVWIEGLGWVGFDVSNAVCPDDRYVRVALGRDYGEAAPVHGLRQGNATEELCVSLQVQQ
ncbi:transglutaminase family protein [Pseudooceanicola sediminis]|uniref:Transglutaminase family protein n=1 Tax=Pseudooceanicola sediminis TaxID=2211117 RepID=A0A399J4F2_9RHOB|nr:transglutaminase family protein [Pseudooceanicola sediminis]KAA2314748.1 transglutaminase family protein [Puniceibacterium sp. HSS470]RII39299.1 transglutaminase family protein [Pseudooceanicola sediminis]|tara:strand:- start:137115 stop:137918 length:804 start_codon:yes stop_codon:yes gene_type:complete